MTEYDYSPEGYQRYLETQDRISRWVDTAEAHRHQFKTPFGLRTDVVESEQWDGVSRTSRRDDDRRSTTRAGPPPPPLYHPTPVPAAGMTPSPAQTWHQTRGEPTGVQYQQQQPAYVITQQSKRKSSKSHKSHKSSSRSRPPPTTYIIHTPGVPPMPTVQPPPPPGQYGPSSNTSSVTYITTDHTGYPVTHTAPLHQIPGSVYSYSTPPAVASSPPVYANPPPPPMMSPYTSPPTSPPLPGSYHHPQPNVVYLPPNTRTRTIKVMY
ncbi:hypothetical protein AAF712_003885 [Marasmius tenuissimus]|uniref:Extensin-like n=1 Tax=Marasmius tenuissimus TaxID=585030 RepID=A0ABR3A8N1_9AGAR